MSIHFCDSYPESLPSNIGDLIEKFEETTDQDHRHLFFSEAELLALLDVCKLAENKKARSIDNTTEYGLTGFSVISNDRAPIEAMLEAKRKNGRAWYEYCFGPVTKELG
jgi:hypothetical protein